MRETAADGMRCGAVMLVGYVPPAHAAAQHCSERRRTRDAAPGIDRSSRAPRLFCPDLQARSRTTTSLPMAVRRRPLKGSASGSFDRSCFSERNITLVRWIVARSLGDSPGQHDSVEFEAQVVVQACRGVFLNDEGQGCARTTEIGTGLWRPLEIALGAVSR